MNRTHRVLRDDDPVVRDHRIGGVPVLPAAAQIEFILAACDAARPDSHWRLEQTAFVAPLRLDAGPLDIEITADTAGQCTIGAQQQLYCQTRATATALPPPRYLDTAALRAGCTNPLPLSEIARWRQTSGIDYGPTYQAIRMAHRGPASIFAVLRCPDDTTGTWFVPPSLLDSAFQCLGILAGDVSGPTLPWYVGRIEARRAVSGTVLALVELAGDHDAGGSIVRGRVTICNQQGEVLVELDQIVLKSATPEPAPSDDSPITTVEWRPVTPTPDPTASPVVLLAPHDLHTERIDAALAGTSPREIVYVAPPGITDADTAMAQLRGIFALVQRLATRPPIPPITIVTRAAHHIAYHDDVEPLHTALWGLARTLRIEYPRTRIRLVDLGPGDDTVTPEEICHTEPELARRAGQWYAPSPTPVRASVPLTGFDGGRFLVIGGMGGIGLHVARFLADSGCAHLTLLGRTVPKDGEHRERLDRIAELCDVEIVQGDVRAIGELLRDAKTFDGVFHAAGVLRDGLARSLSAQMLDEVFAPKIGGVHALDAAFPAGARPGFVALFSSISAVYGNLGQSSYAAANAYLDGYAARKRAQGEAWYSLDWGLWTVGMGEAVAESAAARGIHALTVDEGLTLLRTAVSLPPANYILSAPTSRTASSTASSNASALSSTANRPFSSTANRTLSSTANRTPKREDQQMTVVTQQPELWPTLSAILKKTLHVNAVHPDDNLLEMGLDSMMAVEIAAALSAQGVETDPAVLFEHSNVEALIRYLESKAHHRPTATMPESVAPPPRAMPAAPITTPVSAPQPNFVPDWDRFRDLGPAQPSAPAMPSVSPPPQPVRTQSPLPATVLAPPQPVRTQSSVPATVLAPPPHHANGHPTPAAPVAPHSGQTPRRTLPARLTSMPHGSFLDRRIDALSEEDRVIVAQDDYFYEPVIEQAQGSWIKFDGRWFLNLASYSYLGLIGHDYITGQAQRAAERHGTGAHGVRLLAGTLHLHRELEQTIARFLGTEDAIVYSGGYIANVATIGALVGPGDTIIGDVYNHASILDGYRLSGANVITYAHNDLNDLERALRKAEGTGKLVVTDAVFSMDGDIANLPGIVELCERYDAALMVDEAHSLGVLGATGRGITEHFGIDPARVAVKMGTLSKTVPSAGGYVAGSSDLIFALKNNARGWMFSAAATPMQVAAAKAAFEVIAAAPRLVGELRARTDRYRNNLHQLGFDTLASQTPVVPIICGSAEQAHAMARHCQRDGLFVQPIVYPAVPRTLPRLRTIVNLSHSDADLDQAVATLEKAGRGIGLIA